MKLNKAAIAFVALMLLALPLIACAGVNTQYAKAVSDTHAIVFPDHRKYVQADEALTDEQKERRMRLLDSAEELDKEALKD